ncbi:MAG TPA: sigma-70 family RNA polymerase sigma factor [Pseudonocardiaceae bacterium]|jgi:RNA polymerase sigma-70 factor (ECF subfamily)|nr:sigma-70 family RNA polymerase sigma factor [Pseudonocardiaceae bacterium]
MVGRDGLAERFEGHRAVLCGVAYRLLGSASEADDAVQEAWFRLSRVDVDGVENLAGWLRTVVSRVCLDMLRVRRARREELVGSVPERVWDGSGPEPEAVLIDTVGRALVVVLDALGPAERVAFVLHDMFAVPFEEIAVIVGRSVVATKKLASRARQRVRGRSVVSGGELAGHREVVEAFLVAARGGDVAGLLAVLAPDVVRRADPAALPVGGSVVLRGADAVARGTVGFAARARFAAVALVDGAVGVVVAPGGRLLFVLTVRVVAGRIAAYEVVADPVRLRGMEVAVL